VRPEDWDELHAMPERHVVLHPRLWYSTEDMAAIRRGFYPTVMEQKWFLTFTDNRLRMYRSWTGYLIIDVGFTFDPKGASYVSDVIVNREHEQYQQDDVDEDLTLMKNVIQGHLLMPLDAPVEDGFALALQQATKPNYLGSPDVVGKLIASIIDVVVRDYISDPEFRDDVLNTREQVALTESLPSEIDRGVLARGVISALSGFDDAYTTMPTWHSAGELGSNIMEHLAPKISFTGYESLYELVAEGIKQVIDKAYQLLMAYYEDPQATWDEHVLPQLQALHQYVTAVMLGTNTVTYGKKTLDDTRWQAA
jgi:hypothetical protein